MRKPVVVIVVILVVLICVAAAMAMMRKSNESEWTTRSPEALAEFRKGLNAEMKFYRREAAAHFERAVALDPEFAFARIKAANYAPRKNRPPFEKVVASIDQSKLNERERFLIEYHVLRGKRLQPEAMSKVDRYLEKHPADSFILSLRCEDAWARRDWPVAERCYSKLIKTDPNWVSAQNNLGYIAMAQGRFEDAEELFKTYLYIAPDQANPHDSLGELFTLRGRYEEAARELQTAIQIRPDFCASWGHLMLVAMLKGDLKAGEELLVKAEKESGCEPAFYLKQRCTLTMWSLADQGRWSEIVPTATGSGCIGQDGDATVLAHRAAIMGGSREEALLMEASVREVIQKVHSHSHGPYPVLFHMEGVRLGHEGAHSEAVKRLKAADEKMFFWGEGEGIFKLYNKLMLARALERAGDKPGAKAELEGISRVNPHFIGRFHSDR